MHSAAVGQTGLSDWRAVAITRRSWPHVYAALPRGVRLRTLFMASVTRSR